MTTKHTHAPWSYHELSGDVRTSEQCEKQKTIARINHHLEQSESNAKLIAAAPDLLEILQLMAEKDFDFSEHECRLARMAIAKATQ